MVRSIFFAAGLVAVASARISKRTAPLAESCEQGWKYNECIEITSGYPVSGDAPDNFHDGYHPKACQAFCMKEKKAGKSIKYAAITADFCECYGDSLKDNKAVVDEAKCKTKCPKDDFYCGTYNKGTPGDWYYAVYECSDDVPVVPSSSSSVYVHESSSSAPVVHDSSSSSVYVHDSSSSSAPATSSSGYTHATTSMSHGGHPQITSTYTETIVETVTKCPEDKPNCPNKKTKTVTTTTCYAASQYTKSYDETETVTITKCPETVEHCPLKTTTSVKPCSSVVVYDPSASYVCGNDLCAKPTGSDKSSGKGCTGASCGKDSDDDSTSSSSDKTCYGAGSGSGSGSGSKTSNSTLPKGTGSAGCTGPECYKTAGAAREGVVATIALVAGLGLGVAALF